MPPRKKPDNSSTSVATRSSARVKAAATKPAIKPHSKRPHSDSEPGDDVTPKPRSKKVKKDESQQDNAQVIQKDEESQKMVTIMKRGPAPVDPMSGKVDSHQVYSSAEGVWDAMLNQTVVSANQNKNKFYVIQLLHPVGNNSSCVLYTRWGRVGEGGQNQVKGPFTSQIAVTEFKKQFRSKTGVAWEQRVGMTARKGKYVWLERDFEDDEKVEEPTNKPKSKKEVVPDSQLVPEIQEFCKLIFSTSIIDATLSSMNYDAKKLPLGKLAKVTILNGFAALKRLSEVIEKPDANVIGEYGSQRAACEHLSSVYYSIIPHDFGRQRPLVIDSIHLLKKELDLVDALGDMEIASKLISSTVLADEEGNPINPLDANFRSLSLDVMDPVERSSQEFKVLEAYVNDTHGATHQYYGVTVQNIFRVQRNGEQDNWIIAGCDKLNEGERLLLWHGSRTTNFAGILKQGLRIAPPEAPVSGYMFGKGVYFADMMSKSANYCHTYLSNGIGLLLLCEVAAKPFYERTVAVRH
ncbi:hypothetical protein AMATHDRAFT_52452 [Amanita thiersii Skay4041]|uniref:Poly [ADP-ribose] polymerase n=1 Tax=Amanita thiersii Skay4041 TaxID=703135 RepID=A0A2A9P1U1_9AGAR|nr:hypothetical protein AMATHDRAFT_52452 [Amanita thiersii Skay4041]